MSALPFQRLVAWQACHALTLAIYAATDRFPREERYGLTSQARRAAFSAEANIAEGSAKHGKRECRRFLDISIGSLSELACALLLSRDRGYLSEKDWARLERIRGRAGFLTWRLYDSLRH
ncbi:MAG: four helix bundle protein [Gemmatimonadetes bacterium]|nr:four helix bundle protein [Gemmatimonadota bacterium]